MGGKDVGLVALSGVLVFTLAGATLHARTTPSMAAPAARAAAPASASATDAATALSQATIKAAAEVGPKVVLITSSVGLGSGEVIDSRGYIVTNYHVLAGDKGTQLHPPFKVTMSNGKTYTASVAGTASVDDLAVLKINAGKLSTISMGDSSKLQVGEFVLAVGNPLGYAQTVTFGIVSTLNRGLPEGSPATFLPDLIQTSAPINPGNSGGALVNLQGQLVGIPTLAAVDPQQGGPAQGIGFAIPVNRVKFIADQIIKDGKVTNTGQAYLGIGAIPITPQLQAQYGLPVSSGVLIASVVSNGPASKAGLKQGDIITGINGTALTGNNQLLSIIYSDKPGQKVTLQILDTNGKKHNVDVTLGTLPANPH